MIVSGEGLVSYWCKLGRVKFVKGNFGICKLGDLLVFVILIGWGVLVLGFCMMFVLFVFVFFERRDMMIMELVEVFVCLICCVGMLIDMEGLCLGV